MIRMVSRLRLPPINFSIDMSISFEMSIDTHQGSLDFDLLDVTLLETSEGKRFTALSWNGSPPGNHHRSGVLSFPSIGETESLSLVISNVYEVSERIFKWDI